MKSRSFLPAHFLEDLETKYVNSIYYYQELVKLQSPHQGAARAKMNKLEAEIRKIKYGY